MRFFSQASPEGEITNLQRSMSGLDGN
ncbi:hypothetical protein Nmel_010775 [Mimus melanotis]